MVTTSCSSTTGMISTPSSSCAAGTDIDRHATRNALDRHLLLLQRDLGNFVPLLDPGADHDPAPLDLALADLELFFGQLDAFGSVLLMHR